jgi:NitT/TauT family transport system ATP-binding protein
MAKKKLELKDLSFAYASLAALDGVTFDVDEGEFVSIVGPSGCGKSTMLGVIDGLIPASRGEIILDGKEVSAPGHDRALVFQEPSLLPWRTVLTNITFGLECRNATRREANEKANGLIRLVGLDGFAHAYPYQLSGGMQQRVNLARALAVDPEVLLMDEPFAALDEIARDRLNEELLRLHAEQKWTVLFVTHSVAEAVFLSSRVVILAAHPGRIAHEVPIDLPWPRTAETRESIEFEEAVTHASRLLRGVVQA